MITVTFLSNKLMMLTSPDYFHVVQIQTGMHDFEKGVTRVTHIKTNQLLMTAPRIM